MITKQIAGILYGNSYRLYEVATEKVWDIQELYANSVYAVDNLGNTRYISFSQIGTDFLIIARPLSDLTKEIEGVGVPIDLIHKEMTEKDHDNFAVVEHYMALKWHFAINLPERTWIDINQIEK